MIGALLDRVAEHISGEGAWWILGLNAILVIPLIFSVFFYPWEVLAGVAAAFALTAVALVVTRFVRVRLHRHA